MTPTTLTINIKMYIYIIYSPHVQLSKNGNVAANLGKDNVAGQFRVLPDPGPSEKDRKKISK